MARCIAKWLMRKLGLRGSHRAKTMRTVIAGKNARNVADLVRRYFWIATPKQAVGG